MGDHSTLAGESTREKQERSPGSMPEYPYITVVMPVRNEERCIAATLEQVLRQDYPKDRFEVIVADGMSEDKTRQIVAAFAQKHPQVRLLDNPGMRSGTGRNVGFMNGRGDIFLVIDGHCFIPTDRLLINIVLSFEKSKAHCLGRPQPLDPPNLGDFQKAVALARSSRIGHSGHSFIYSEYEGFGSPVSVGAVYKKEVFEKIGYVDETFDACEDVEFNYRVEKAGFSTYISPLLSIKYYPREDLIKFFHQMVRYGMGRVKFVQKNREVMNLDMLIPPAFAVCLMSLPIAGLIWPFFWWTWITLLASYIGVILFTSTKMALQHGFRHFKYLPLIFFVIHFGLGWGLIKGFLKGIGGVVEKRMSGVAAVTSVDKLGKQDR